MRRLDRMGRDLLDDNIWDDYRMLVDAQLAEARGRHADGAGRLPAVCESHDPAAVGPRHGGASAPPAACSPSTARRRRPRRSKAAARLLARWGGWRVAQLDRVRDRLGLTPARRPAR